MQNLQGKYFDFSAYEEAANFIRTRTDLKPELALILGSGLGDFANLLSEKVVIPYREIPNFKTSTVQGHAGNLVFGKFQERLVVVMQGRLHYYEGHTLQEATFPLRVMKLLGVNKLLVTNASGGINTNLVPGDLMIISDHINMLGSNPLIGPNDERFGPRFPDMTNAYNPELRQKIKNAMQQLKMPVKEGVYIAFTGPSFETKAEIQMAARVGADAVGMSTVPEVIVANHMGWQVAGISIVCNLAAGISPNPLTAEEVFATANLAKNDFITLLNLVIPAL